MAWGMRAVREPEPWQLRTGRAATLEKRFAALDAFEARIGGKGARPAAKGKGRGKGTPFLRHAPEASADRRHELTPIKPCSCCGLSNHSRRECFHARKECHKCGRTGHLAHLCRGGAPAVVRSEPVRHQGVPRQGSGKGSSTTPAEGQPLWLCSTCTQPVYNMKIVRCPRQGCMGKRLTEAPPMADPLDAQLPKEQDQEGATAPAADLSDGGKPKRPGATSRQLAELKDSRALMKQMGACTIVIDKCIAEAEPKESQDWQFAKATVAGAQRQANRVANLPKLAEKIEKLVEAQAKRKGDLRATMDKEEKDHLAKMAAMQSQAKLILEENEKEIKEKKEEHAKETMRVEETKARWKEVGTERSMDAAPQEEPTVNGADDELATGTIMTPMPAQDKKAMPELHNEAQVEVFWQAMSLEQQKLFRRSFQKMEEEEKDAEDTNMLAIGDQDKREREGEEDVEPDPKKPKEKM
jgi:hypothetical protein